MDGIGETATAWLGRGSPDGLEEIEKLLTHTRSGCSGNGWPSISDSRNSTPVRSWAWLLMETPGVSPPSMIGSSVLSIMSADSSRPRAPPFLIDPVSGTSSANDVRGLESLFGPRRPPDQSGRPSRGSRTSPPACQRALKRPSWLSRGGWHGNRRDQPCLRGRGRPQLRRQRSARTGRSISIALRAGAAHDAGTAIGAALDIVHHENETRQESMGRRALGLTPFLGSSYDHVAIEAAIARAGLRSRAGR